MSKITYEDFAKVEMRVGKIIQIDDFDRAQNPLYKVKIDFGPDVEIKQSCVQAKCEYTKKELLDRQVICVINIPPKNIAGFMSEVLILGVPAKDGSLSLLEPSRKPARIGGTVY